MHHGLHFSQVETLSQSDDSLLRQPFLNGDVYIVGLLKRSMLKQIQTDRRLDRMLQAKPPRIAEWLLRMVLPKTEHVTVIGELEEEFHASIVPLMGVIRSKLWFWTESLSLIAGYTRVLLIREDSRDLTVVMTARRLRRRWGKQDKGKDRSNRMDSLIQDIRHGYRSLKRRPSFTLAAMLTLAIGIGVNTAIFSLLYAVLIQPLPFQEPDQLVSLHRTKPEWGPLSQSSVSYPDFVTWRNENRVFQDMAAYHSATINLTGSESPERLVAARISYNLLSVLGIHNCCLAQRAEGS